MPRPNRVDPFGDLFATPARGLLTGNRGVLHDAQGRLTKRRWTTRAWIACLLEYKDWKRPIMAPGTWTELFFLDEATAFAAGHRPCGLCRHADYKRFRSAWAAAHGAAERAPAATVDAVLHAERIARPRETWHAACGDLPDGTMWLADGRVWVVADGRVARWTPFGYEDHAPRPSGRRVDVLTPRPLVATFAAGYQPMLHPSATSSRR